MTKYNFSYKLPEHDDTEEHKISFEVTPSSNPPTNVHVLIGRNGTGKTTLIKNMIYSIRSDDETRGTFDYKTPGRFNPTAKFANVVCVAFSPFDDFSELESNDSSIPFSYIGLNKNTDNLLQTITEEFLSSLKECKANSRKRTLWLEAIKILESDPIFEEAKINTFISEDSDVSATFSKLSSGHKVVLLIVTCCVEKIEEKSILFLDEPENHLHPPLLSALIHALSNLLIDRNGVAIISTHSPVILQEVPNHCVWKLTRYDQRLMAERLPIETFGASIGALTNEVFGLEVTNSGFHKRIAQAAKEYDDYDFALSEFENHLGNEAMILLRTLISLNENEEE